MYIKIKRSNEHNKLDDFLRKKMKQRGGYMRYD